MVRVVVPASTSNLGSGFDAFGLALSLYLELSFEESSSYKFVFEGEGANFLPSDERNLICKSLDFFCMKLGEKPRPFLVRTKNGIPVGRGLGSSAAAIVGSLMAANRLYHANLSLEELFQLAVDFEGHADNVSACMFGGFTISYQAGARFKTFSYQTHPDLGVFLLIAPTFLSTRKARQVLPRKVGLKDAVYNLSRASLLALSIVRGDWERIKEAMKDRLHQPYRQSLIPELSFLLEKVDKIQAVLGVSLSGAGPSLVGFYRLSEEGSLKESLEKLLAGEKLNYNLKLLKVENTGANLIEE